MWPQSRRLQHVGMLTAVDTATHVKECMRVGRPTRPSWHARLLTSWIGLLGWHKQHHTFLPACSPACLRSRFLLGWCAAWGPCLHVRKAACCASLPAWLVAASVLVFANMMTCLLVCSACLACTCGDRGREVRNQKTP